MRSKRRWNWTDKQVRKSKRPKRNVCNSAPKEFNEYISTRLTSINRKAIHDLNLHYKCNPLHDIPFYCECEECEFKFLDFWLYDYKEFYNHRTYRHIGHWEFW